jgi:hypothetical protein
MQNRSQGRHATQDVAKGKVHSSASKARSAKAEPEPEAVENGTQTDGGESDPRADQDKGAVKSEGDRAHHREAGAKGPRDAGRPAGRDR